VAAAPVEGEEVAAGAVAAATTVVAKEVAEEEPVWLGAWAG
jgi:hypothetical protein